MQGIEAVYAVGPVKMQLVDGGNGEKSNHRGDAHGAGAGGGAGEPAEAGENRGSGVSGLRGLLLILLDQERSNPSVSQFPEGAIQDEVMNIYERGEGEKAGSKVRVEEAADQPRTGNEQGDAASDQGK